MREIKFRGLRSDGKGWVYGFYSPVNVPILGTLGHCINEGGYRAIDIEIESLGQFTGFKSLHKKNNVDEDIYEGDIFRQIDEADLGDEVTYHVVMWLNERGAFYMIPSDHYPVIRDNGIPKEKEFNWLLDDACLYDFSFDVKLTKVGNIHQNPELLS